MRRVFVLILTFIISGCSSLPQTVPVTIKEGLAVGAHINLNQSIVIPKDRSFIYIANGKVAPLKNFNTVDIYSPYCMFYLKHEAKQPHTIKPGKFEVTKITEWEGYYSLGSLLKYTQLNIQPAGLVKTGFNKAGSNLDSGFEIIMHATILRLHSSAQPEVKEMVCGHWDEQSRVEPLTLDGLKSALGKLMTIEARGI